MSSGRKVDPGQMDRIYCSDLYNCYYGLQGDPSILDWKQHYPDDKGDHSILREEVEAAVITENGEVSGC